MPSRDPAAPDFAIDRQTLLRYFRPPIGKSTFHDLVNPGVIVPIKGVRGYYRLNQSLVRLGLQPVAELPKGEDEGAKGDHILRLALWLIAPDFIERPPWLLTGDPAQEEEALAVLTALYLQPRFATLASDEERRAFIQGAVDAGFLIGDLDGG